MQPATPLPTQAETPAHLAADAKALLTLLTSHMDRSVDHALELERIHLEFFVGHRLYLISAHREHVMVSERVTSEELVGTVTAWDRRAETFDHRRPLLRFRSLDELCTWLLDHTANTLP